MTDAMPQPLLSWRPLGADDLGAVIDIAAQVHPKYPERPEIFADKLAFFAPGCLAAENPAGLVVGYAFAHPWTIGLPPLLDTPLGPRPTDATGLHLHDVAVLPDWRGLGATGQVLTALLALAAGHHLSALTLVAITGQDGFWRARGFTPFAPAGATLERRLASYGAGCAYLVRPLPGLCGSRRPMPRRLSRRAPV